MADIDKKEQKKLPPLTLAMVIACFVLVGLFILGVIFPKYQQVKRAKEALISKSILLEEQKKLFPVYARADALARVTFEPTLPFPERTPLEREKISKLSKVFSEIALENNMELSENSLDVSSLKNRSNSISMDVQFSGDLFDYRNCLISLANLSFFDRIETIKISTDPDDIKKFSTKILINIDKK